MNERDKKKVALSIIFIILSLLLIISNKVDNKKFPLGFKSFEVKDTTLVKAISHWKKLKSINMLKNKNIFNNDLIIVLLFSMRDCGLNLSRVHQYSQYFYSLADSLSEEINISVFGVGLSDKKLALLLYLKASPKPIPILYEKDIDFLKDSFYKLIPMIYIIDNRRKKIKYAKLHILKRKITNEYLLNINKIIIKGW